MGLFGRKKKVKEDSNGEWTSFEFVQFLIKYPDTSDDNFVEMYSNLLGEDNLEKDLEEYWKQRLEESFISQEEFKKIKREFNQRFKKIRKLSQAKNDTKNIAEWAVTNTEEEDRATDDDKTIDENFKD
jgi:membrane-bound lytic murein transglycosylase